MGNACLPFRFEPSSDSVTMEKEIRNNTFRFQYYLSINQFIEALHLALAVSNKLDNSINRLASRPPALCNVMIASFYNSTISVHGQIELLQILKKTGGFTRDLAIVEHSDYKLNAIRIAALHTDSSMFDFWFNDPLFALSDWNIPCSTDGRTPLVALLTCNLVVPAYTSITPEQVEMYENRAVKLIRKMDAAGINQPCFWNQSWWTPLTASIYGVRWAAMQELLKRIPDISLSNSAVQDLDSYGQLHSFVRNHMTNARQAMDKYRHEQLIPQIYLHCCHFSLDLARLVALFVC
jgi:hypothetical protein